MHCVMDLLEIKETDNDDEFIVFRLVLDGKDKREMIKCDKTIVER